MPIFVCEISTLDVWYGVCSTRVQWPLDLGQNASSCGSKPSSLLLPASSGTVSWSHDKCIRLCHICNIISILVSVLWKFSSFHADMVPQIGWWKLVGGTEQRRKGLLCGCLDEEEQRSRPQQAALPDAARCPCQHPSSSADLSTHHATS